MDLLFHDLSSLWILAAAVCVAVATAAWALQLASGFCSVEPPCFTHAVFTVVLIVAANVLLRLILHACGVCEGMTADYLAPAAAAALVIALALPTGPISATLIAVVQIALCAMLYFAAGWIVSLLTVPWYL